jgi:hypothetical protein
LIYRQADLVTIYLDLMTLLDGFYMTEEMVNAQLKLAD